MEFAFPWPVSNGEWLAWWSALITVLFGLLFFLAPGLALRLLRLRPAGPQAGAVARESMAGFYLGIGLSCILLAQPLLYLALGLCWMLSAFGRLISLLIDRHNSPLNWLILILDLVLAALPLAFALGLVS